jgi:hypothetical protein
MKKKYAIIKIPKKSDKLSLFVSKLKTTAIKNRQETINDIWFSIIRGNTIRLSNEINRDQIGA